MHLQFASYAPDVWDRLTALPRAGWVAWRIKNPETVATHTLALIALAHELRPQLDFTQAEFDDLVAMLEIHDWPEAIDGDEVVHVNDSPLKRTEKFEREARTMRMLTLPLGDVGGRILALWHRFENQSDRVAVFAHALDKYQAVEQAYRYERDGGPVGIGLEFLYGSPPVTHPALRARLERECVTSL